MPGTGVGRIDRFGHGPRRPASDSRYGHIPQYEVHGCFAQCLGTEEPGRETGFPDASGGNALYEEAQSVGL